MSRTSDHHRALERLVETSLDRARVEGRAAFERLAQEHPEHAAELRARLAALERLGLLPEAEALPRRLGPYRVEGVLGRGGMGVVYLARDEAGREVAVKVATGARSLDPRALRRFLRETELLATLRHENLVPLLAAGQQDGVPWFAMERVAGATLDQLLAAVRSLGIPASELEASHLARALLPAGDDPAPLLAAWGRTWSEACCRLAADVAAALAFAHERGVVHRDVKPSNVLVGVDGRARLFDFGLARAHDSLDLTRSGEFAGTPHYTAPEQIARRFGPVGPRADVFALGATLHEALLLERPFAGDETQLVLRRILEEAPLLERSRAPHVRRELRAIVERALEKEPGRRYPTAAALCDDLQALLAWRPVEARLRGPVGRLAAAARRKPARALAAMFGLVLAVGAPLVLLLANFAISRQRDRAELAAETASAEARRSRAIATFLEDVLAPGGGADPARIDAALRLAADGLEIAEDERRGDAATRAALLETLARVLMRLSRPEAAVPPLDRALALLQVERGERHPDTGAVLLCLAQAHHAAGDGPAAAALLRRVLAALDAQEAPPSALEVHALCLQARFALADGDPAAAEAAARGALERAADGSPELVDALRALAAARRLRGAPGEALDHLGRALEVERGVPEPRFDVLAVVQAERAEALHDAGQGDAAEQAIDAAVGLALKGSGRDPALLESVLAPWAERARPLAPEGDAALAHGRRFALLARARAERGDRAALDAAACALERLEAAGAAPLERAAVQASVARAQADAGDFAGARDALEEAVAAIPDAPPHVEPWMPEALFAQARVLEREGRNAEAAALHDRRARLVQQTLDTPEADPEAAQRALLAAARLHAASGDAPRAARLLREAEDLATAFAARDVARPFALGRETVEGDEDRAALYEARFQEGVTALQGGNYEYAERCFAASLEVLPGRSVSAYNAACARAALGDADAAFRWLERAKELGLAARPEALALLLFDPDVDALRGDPRFAAFLADMERRRAAAQERARAYALVLPEEGAAHGPLPLLVVLHARGSSHEAVAAGPWREVARRLGCALLAPSGSFSAGEDGAGAAWFDALDAYARRALVHERGVDEAMRAARERTAIDASRIVLAGEGQGGLVAMRVAARSPGLFRAVVLVDAAVALDLIRERGGNLGLLRLPVVLAHDPSRPIDLLGRRVDPNRYVDGLARRLEAWGLPVTRLGEVDAESLAIAIAPLLR